MFHFHRLGAFFYCVRALSRHVQIKEFSGFANGTKTDFQLIDFARLELALCEFGFYAAVYVSCQLNFIPWIVAVISTFFSKQLQNREIESSRCKIAHG